MRETHQLGCRDCRELGSRGDGRGLRAMTHRQRGASSALPWLFAGAVLALGVSALARPTSIQDDHLDDLRRRHLTVPVQGVAPSKLTDTFKDFRAGGVQHDGIDILAPRRTPVIAVEDGTIEKL